MDFLDGEEYNLIFQNEGFENIMLKEDLNDNDQVNMIPFANNMDDHQTSHKNTINKSLPPTNLKEYYLSDYAKFELFLWLYNHQKNPYMNTETKKRYAKRFNVTTEAIALFLNEQRCITKMKNDNANQNNCNHPDYKI